MVSSYVLREYIYHGQKFTKIKTHFGLFLNHEFTVLVSRVYVIILSLY